MSTNKTQNYQLHSWTPEDDFRLHEINENFTKLDTAVAQAIARPVVGQYTMLGESPVLVSLGFRPRAVMLDISNGGSSYIIGAFVTDLMDISYCIDRSRRMISAEILGITLTDDGFTIPANANNFNSNPNYIVKYQAFR